MKFEELPLPVRNAARHLAFSAKAAGGEAFVFGSFARGEARRTSDLDIGFILPSTAPAELPSALRRMAENFPTVRMVEVVDFTQLNPEFRAIAGTDRLPL